MLNSNSEIKIVLAGGGTGGSVMPLLALIPEIKKIIPQAKFIFFGTKKGQPEKMLVEKYNLPFYSIFSGKLRRYFDWRNFIDPILIILGFFESLFLLLKIRPKIIVGAGGYVSFPLILAGWFLKIPSLIHQQDVIPSLTNRILSPFAKKITVTFEETLKSFPKSKTILTGNPVRKEILEGNKEEAIKFFNLEKNRPVILVLGGGTGSKFINNLIYQSLDELLKFTQIIHITGSRDNKENLRQFKYRVGYHQFKFLKGKIKDALKIADLVISRAGMGILTELSALGKPSIIIPIPNSHQIANAKIYEKNKAIIILNQQEIQIQKFLDIVKKLLFNQKKLMELSKNIKNMSNLKAGEKIAQEIIKLIKI